MSSVLLKMISSMATREVLVELAGQYQRASGCVVAAEAAGGVDVAKRVQQGEVFDVVVLAGDAIDKLIAAEKLLADSRVGVVKSGVAIAVKSGVSRPSIANEESVKDAVSNAKSLSYSTGPSGVYLEKLFAKWGILETIKPRIMVPPPGTPVAKLIATGAVELGFQQLSEMKTYPGIDVLGPLPDEIQTITSFVGAVCSGSSQQAAARALLSYLASSETTATKIRFGLESG
jgi:molybdate transport system substrate-binding protein